MRGPVCGCGLYQVRRRDGVIMYYCLSCGWGLERLTSLGCYSPQGIKPQRLFDEPPQSGVMLLFLWLASLGFMILPCLLLHWGMIDGGAIRLNDPRYWVCVAIYLIAGAIMTPSPNPDRLAWVNRWWLQHPVDPADWLNCLLLFLGLMFVPAKWFWLALYSSWHLVRRWSAVNRSHPAH